MMYVQADAAKIENEEPKCRLADVAGEDVDDLALRGIDK